jgi:formate dehydrogenase maturation protein FdhE
MKPSKRTTAPAETEAPALTIPAATAAPASPGEDLPKACPHCGAVGSVRHGGVRRNIRTNGRKMLQCLQCGARWYVSRKCPLCGHSKDVVFGPPNKDGFV